MDKSKLLPLLAVSLMLLVPLSPFILDYSDKPLYSGAEINGEGQVEYHVPISTYEDLYNFSQLVNSGEGSNYNAVLTNDIVINATDDLNGGHSITVDLSITMNGSTITAINATAKSLSGAIKGKMYWGVNAVNFAYSSTVDGYYISTATVSYGESPESGRPLVFAGFLDLGNSGNTENYVRFTWATIPWFNYTIGNVTYPIYPNTGTFSTNGNMDPIGTTANPYTGVFDGAGHTIYGLQILSSGYGDSTLSSIDCYAALFGVVTAPSGSTVGGVIKNLSLNMGVVMGFGGVSSTAGLGYAAAFVAKITGAGTEIKNCHMINVAVSIGTDQPNPTWAGGIAAYADSTTIRDCSVSRPVGSYGGGSVRVGNTGDASSIANAGGIVGEMIGSYTGAANDAARADPSNYIGVVDNCSVGAQVTATPAGSANAGGIVGTMRGGAVTNCFTSGGSDTDYVVTAYSTRQAYAGGSVGQIVGSSASQVTLVLNCYNICVVESRSSEQTSYSGGIVGYTDDYQIYSYIVGCYNAGEIRSIAPADTAYAGGIVGRTSGHIQSGYNSGDVIARADKLVYIGGLVGVLRGNASYSYNTGNLTAETQGYSAGTDYRIYAGGIVGATNDSQISSTISNSYNSGTISLTDATVVYAGGILGAVSISGTGTKTTITECYSEALSAADTIAFAPIFQPLRVVTAYMGGVVGYSASSLDVMDSYCKGSITISLSSTAAASSTVWAGGVIGYGGSADQTVANCYFIGLIPESRVNGTASGYGGIAGSFSGTITESYFIYDSATAPYSSYMLYLNTTNVPTVNVSGTGQDNVKGRRTAVQLQTQSTFAGWDMTGIWGIQHGLNNGNPYLRDSVYTIDLDPAMDPAYTVTILTGGISWGDTLMPFTNVAFEVKMTDPSDTSIPLASIMAELPNGFELEMRDSTRGQVAGQYSLNGISGQVTVSVTSYSAMAMVEMDINFSGGRTAVNYNWSLGGSSGSGSISSSGKIYVPLGSQVSFSTTDSSSVSWANGSTVRNYSSTFTVNSAAPSVIDIYLIGAATAGSQTSGGTAYVSLSPSPDSAAAVSFNDHSSQIYYKAVPNSAEGYVFDGWYKAVRGYNGEIIDTYIYSTSEEITYTLGDGEYEVTLVASFSNGHLVTFEAEKDAGRIVLESDTVPDMVLPNKFGLKLRAMMAIDASLAVVTDPTQDDTNGIYYRSEGWTESYDSVQNTIGNDSTNPANGQNAVLYKPAASTYEIGMKANLIQMHKITWTDEENDESFVIGIPSGYDGYRDIYGNLVSTLADYDINQQKYTWADHDNDIEFAIGGAEGYRIDKAEYKIGAGSYLAISPVSDVYALTADVGGNVTVRISYIEVRDVIIDGSVGFNFSFEILEGNPAGGGASYSILDRDPYTIDRGDTLTFKLGQIGSFLVKSIKWEMYDDNDQVVKSGNISDGFVEYPLGSGVYNWNFDTIYTILENDLNNRTPLVITGDIKITIETSPNTVTWDKNDGSYTLTPPAQDYNDSTGIWDSNDPFLFEVEASPGYRVTKVWYTMGTGTYTLFDTENSYTPPGGNQSQKDLRTADSIHLSTIYNVVSNVIIHVETVESHIVSWDNSASAQEKYTVSSNDYPGFISGKDTIDAGDDFVFQVHPQIGTDQVSGAPLYYGIKSVKYTQGGQTYTLFDYSLLGAADSKAVMVYSANGWEFRIPNVSGDIVILIEMDVAYSVTWTDTQYLVVNSGMLGISSGDYLFGGTQLTFTVNEPNSGYMLTSLSYAQGGSSTTLTVGPAGTVYTISVQDNVTITMGSSVSRVIQWDTEDDDFSLVPTDPAGFESGQKVTYNYVFKFTIDPAEGYRVKEVRYLSGTGGATTVIYPDQYGVYSITANTAVAVNPIVITVEMQRIYTVTDGGIPNDLDYTVSVTSTINADGSVDAGNPFEFTLSTTDPTVYGLTPKAYIKLSDGTRGAAIEITSLGGNSYRIAAVNSDVILDIIEVFKVTLPASDPDDFTVTGDTVRGAAYGDGITFTITPAEGKRITVTADNGYTVVDNGNGSYTIANITSKDITVSVTVSRITVYIPADPKGGIDYTPSETTVTSQVPASSNVSFTITAANGKKLTITATYANGTAVTGFNAVLNGQIYTCTIPSASVNSQNINISIVVSEITVYIPADPNSGADYTPSSTAVTSQVPASSNVTFTITAANGKKLTITATYADGTPVTGFAAILNGQIYNCTIPSGSVNSQNINISIVVSEITVYIPTDPNAGADYSASDSEIASPYPASSKLTFTVTAANGKKLTITATYADGTSVTGFTAILNGQAYLCTIPSGSVNVQNINISIVVSEITVYIPTDPNGGDDYAASDTSITSPYPASSDITFTITAANGKKLTITATYADGTPVTGFTATLNGQAYLCTIPSGSVNAQNINISIVVSEITVYIPADSTGRDYTASDSSITSSYPTSSDITFTITAADGKKLTITATYADGTPVTGFSAILSGQVYNCTIPSGSINTQNIHLSVTVSEITVYIPADPNGGADYTPSSTEITSSYPTSADTTFTITAANGKKLTITAAYEDGTPLTLQISVSGQAYTCTIPSSLVNTQNIRITIIVSEITVFIPADPNGGADYTPSTTSVTSSNPASNNITFTVTAANGKKLTITATYADGSAVPGFSALLSGQAYTCTIPSGSVNSQNIHISIVVAEITVYIPADPNSGADYTPSSTSVKSDVPASSNVTFTITAANGKKLTITATYADGTPVTGFTATLNGQVYTCTIPSGYVNSQNINIAVSVSHITVYLPNDTSEYTVDPEGDVEWSIGTTFTFIVDSSHTIVVQAYYGDLSSVPFTVEVLDSTRTRYTIDAQYVTDNIHISIGIQTKVTIPQSVPNEFTISPEGENDAIVDQNFYFWITNVDGKQVSVTAYLTASPGTSVTVYRDSQSGAYYVIPSGNVTVVVEIVEITVYIPADPNNGADYTPSSTTVTSDVPASSNVTFTVTAANGKKLTIKATYADGTMVTGFAAILNGQIYNCTIPSGSISGQNIIITIIVSEITVYIPDDSSGRDYTVSDTSITSPYPASNNITFTVTAADGKKLTITVTYRDGTPVTGFTALLSGQIYTCTIPAAFITAQNIDISIVVSEITVYIPADPNGGADYTPSSTTITSEVPASSNITFTITAANGKKLTITATYADGTPVTGFTALLSGQVYSCTVPSASVTAQNIIITITVSEITVYIPADPNSGADYTPSATAVTSSNPTSSDVIFTITAANGKKLTITATYADGSAVPGFSAMLSGQTYTCNIPSGSVNSQNINISIVVSETTVYIPADPTGRGYTVSDTEITSPYPASSNITFTVTVADGKKLTITATYADGTPVTGFTAILNGQVYVCTVPFGSINTQNIDISIVVSEITVYIPADPNNGIDYTTSDSEKFSPSPASSDITFTVTPAEGKRLDITAIHIGGSSVAGFTAVWDSVNKRYNCTIPSSSVGTDNIQISIVVSEITVYIPADPNAGADYTPSSTSVTSDVPAAANLTFTVTAADGKKLTITATYADGTSVAGFTATLNGQVYTCIIPMGSIDTQNINISIIVSEITVYIPADPNAGADYTPSSTSVTSDVPASSEISFIVTAANGKKLIITAAYADGTTVSGFAVSVNGQVYTCTIPAALITTQNIRISIVVSEITISIPTDPSGGDDYTTSHTSITSSYPASADINFTVTAADGKKLTITATYADGTPVTGFTATLNGQVYTCTIPSGYVTAQNIRISITVSEITVYIPTDPNGGVDYSKPMADVTSQVPASSDVTFTIVAADGKKLTITATYADGSAVPGFSALLSGQMYTCTIPSGYVNSQNINISIVVSETTVYIPADPNNGADYTPSSTAVTSDVPANSDVTFTITAANGKKLTITAAYADGTPVTGFTANLSGQIYTCTIPSSAVNTQIIMITVTVSEITVYIPDDSTGRDYSVSATEMTSPYLASADITFTVTAADGKKLTITATYADGTPVTGFTALLSGQAYSCTIPFAQISTQNIIITITVSEITIYIPADPNAGADYTPSSTTVTSEVPASSNVTFTVTAANGKKLTITATYADGTSVAGFTATLNGQVYTCTITSGSVNSQNIIITITVSEITVYLPEDPLSWDIVNPSSGSTISVPTDGSSVTFAVSAVEGKQLSITAKYSDGTNVSVSVSLSNGVYTCTIDGQDIVSKMMNIAVTVTVTHVTVYLPPSVTDDYIVQDPKDIQIAYGGDVTFTVTPVAGKLITVTAYDQTGTPVTVEFIGGNTYRITGVTDNLNVSVSLTHVTVYLPPSVPESYTVQDDREVAVDIGDDIIFTITPERGKTIVVTAVLVDTGVSVNVESLGNNQYRIVNVQGNITVAVTVDSVTVYLPASVPGDYTIIGDRENVVGIGDNFLFIISIEPGKRISVTAFDTSGNPIDVILGRNGYTIENITDNIFVTVTVVGITVTLPDFEIGTYSISPTGTVDASTDADFVFMVISVQTKAISVTAVYEEGGNVILSYDPVTGACRILKEHLTGNIIVTVTVTHVTVALPSSVEDMYSITPTEDVMVSVEEDFVFSVTALKGRAAVVTAIYSISQLEVPIYFDPDTNTYRIYASDLTDNIIVSVNVGDIRQIVIEAGDGVNTDPSGTVNVITGEDLTVTISPKPGYRITDVIIDGVSMGPIREYTFTNIQDGHTIKVEYESSKSSGSGSISTTTMVVLALLAVVAAVFVVMYSYMTWRGKD